MPHKTCPYSWRSSRNRPSRPAQAQRLQERKPITLILSTKHLRPVTCQTHTGKGYLCQWSTLPRKHITEMLFNRDSLSHAWLDLEPLIQIWPSTYFASVSFYLFVHNQNAGTDRTGGPSALSGPEPVWLSGTGREGCREADVWRGL